MKWGITTTSYILCLSNHWTKLWTKPKFKIFTFRLFFCKFHISPLKLKFSLIFFLNLITVPLLPIWDSQDTHKLRKRRKHTQLILAYFAYYSRVVFIRKLCHENKIDSVSSFLFRQEKVNTFHNTNWKKKYSNVFFAIIQNTNLST